MTNFLDCGHPASPHENFTTGYGRDDKGKTSCYDCCTKLERQFMLENGKTVLYLVKRDDGYHVTNWSGYLDLKVKSYKTGRHNLAGIRYDVWFTFESQNWHGVTFGDMTQICHCKKVK